VTFAFMRAAFLALVRLDYGMAPRPRFKHAAVGIGRKVRVPVSGGERLMSEERLDVVERDAVLHQPGGGRVPHGSGREPADPVLAVVAEPEATLAFLVVVALARRQPAARPRGFHGGYHTR
jgi:hypothetical protein